jgi:hypothetical protein
LTPGAALRGRFASLGSPALQVVSRVNAEKNNHFAKKVFFSFPSSQHAPLLTRRRFFASGFTALVVLRDKADLFVTQGVSNGSYGVSGNALERFGQKQNGEY